MKLLLYKVALISFYGKSFLTLTAEMWLFF